MNPVPWYSLPDWPYLISSTHQVWRQTQRGGHPLTPRPGGRVTLTHYGRSRNARIADLLAEAMTQGPPVAGPPEPEQFLPLPDDPSILISQLGNVRGPVTPFWLRGFLRLKVGPHPRRLHNLVADLHLPDKPADATHAFFLTPDRSNCAISNLSWTKPRPIEKKTGRPMSPQQVWAINKRKRTT